MFQYKTIDGKTTSRRVMRALVLGVARDTPVGAAPFKNQNLQIEFDGLFDVLLNDTIRQECIDYLRDLGMKYEFDNDKTQRIFTHAMQSAEHSMRSIRWSAWDIFSRWAKEDENSSPTMADAVATVLDSSERLGHLVTSSQSAIIALTNECELSQEKDIRNRLILIPFSMKYKELANPIYTTVWCHSRRYARLHRSNYHWYVLLASE